jgi:hypothetical protein
MIPKEVQSPRSGLRVLEPGLYTLVVDLGRQHHRSLGVPVGGAAERASLALGNALVGNPPDAAALEVCLTGPTLEADVQLACVVYGAPFATTLIKVARAWSRCVPVRSCLAFRPRSTRGSCRRLFPRTRRVTHSMTAGRASRMPSLRTGFCHPK